MDTSRTAVPAAALARTAVACARVAAVTTYARHPSGHTTTPASVSGREDGSVEVAVSASSVAFRQLLARPLATVRVAPAWCEPVLLHGSAQRLPANDGTGRVLFHVRAASVRVGLESLPVDPDAYAQAAPDPLRHDAPSVLSHLNGGHRDALAACLRAGGHDVGFAQASSLDAAGLTVTAVGSEGVSTVRLAFPHPVTGLRELPGGLRALLGSGCGGCGHDRRAETADGG